jgi:hypothetical protein
MYDTMELHKKPELGNVTVLGAVGEADLLQFPDLQMTMTGAVGGWVVLSWVLWK